MNNDDYRKAYKKNWPKHHLGEMMNFLETIYPDGLSGRQLSRDFGVTPQGVSAIFKKDDMRLSKAEHIASLYGYKLRLFFPTFKSYDWFTPPQPRRTFPNAKNLEGLVQYIYDKGWTANYIANLTQKSPATIIKAFDSGDIKISTLNAILDKLEICAIWKFTPVEKDVPETEKQS